MMFDWKPGCHSGDPQELSLPCSSRKTAGPGRVQTDLGAEKKSF